MTGLIVVAVLFAAALGFGGVQTFNLRACQRQYASAVATYETAIAKQNEKVSEWEGKAKVTQAKAVQAGKVAAEATRASKQRETTILAAERPPPGASCEAREISLVSLLRRARTR